MCHAAMETGPMNGTQKDLKIPIDLEKGLSFKLFGQLEEKTALNS